jgi:hypothetical protein
LAGANSANLGDAPFAVSVEGIETEPPEAASGRNRTRMDLVRLRVRIRPDAKPGRYPIRLVGRNGLSNALSLKVVEHPVLSEPEGPHDARETAIAVSNMPAVYAGRLAKRGETDYYAFHTDAGQTLTFQLTSGFPQIAAGGSAATVPNFDPALAIYEPAGSWFDSGRLNRIAFNDEPVWVFGKPTDAYLVAAWAERDWTRRLTPDRLNILAMRGGQGAAHPSIETWRAAAEPVPFKIPGTIDGVLARPGEIHRARFSVERAADIAIEIETPAAAPPYFNPIFRLLNPSGEEVAGNVFAGRGACSGTMTKSMQPKTILPLREPGDYTIEIRDATANLAGPDFGYRIQVRPQVPHVGQVRLDVDNVNLAQGQARTIRLSFDREEDYRGAVLVAAESLPPGVSALPGADFEPEKDPRAPAGRGERYTPRADRLVVVVTANEDAPVSPRPYEARLVVRTLVDGKPGEVVASRTIPMMVVAKP